MQTNEKYNAEERVLLELTRQYQATADNNRRGRILESAVSHFDGFIRRLKMKLPFADIEDFRQHIMICFWKRDYLGRYDFETMKIRGYIMNRINYCGLNMHTAGKRPANIMNNQAASIFSDASARADDDRELIDILPDKAKGTEASVFANMESAGQRQFLQSLMPGLTPPRQRMLGALLNKPDSNYAELAAACGCSPERARQTMSYLMRLAAMRLRQTNQQ
ncbi:MAG: hypothetical protein LBL46_01885 [Rickettsiales bacterium]|jgi:hypothetical protein|nr:hypothetical protein [Rickettsiales bacterium]